MGVGVQQNFERHSKITAACHGSAPLCICHVAAVCRRVRGEIPGPSFGSRTALLNAVSRLHEDIFDRSIDVQVLRLRRKLEVDPSAPRVIQTERGVGSVGEPI